MLGFSQQQLLSCVSPVANTSTPFVIIYLLLLGTFGAGRHKRRKKEEKRLVSELTSKSEVKVVVSRALSFWQAVLGLSGILW